jgi:hypothetical protein
MGSARQTFPGRSINNFYLPREKADPTAPNSLTGYGFGIFRTLFILYIKPELSVARFSDFGS